MAQIQPSPADVVIALFGGIRPMAAKGKWPVSTVQRWKDSGYIPAHRHDEVMAIGRAFGVPVEHKHFFSAKAA